MPLLETSPSEIMEEHLRAVEARLQAILNGLGRHPYFLNNINFDQDPNGQNIADGTMLDNMYQSSGCVFSFIPTAPKGTVFGTHVYARSVNAHSAPNSITPVLGPAVITGTDDSWGKMKASFTSPAKTVTIYAMPMPNPESLGRIKAVPYLQAYDSNNNLLGEVLYPIAYGNAGYGSYQPLTFASSANDIAYVLFSSQYDGSAPVYGLFDDFSFTSALW